jgi:hypothetical protein
MRLSSFLLLILAVSCSCSEPTDSTASSEPEVSSAAATDDAGEQAEPGSEPDLIRVQHILIGFRDAVGFRGSAPKGASQRTKSEAKTLAEALLARAKKGEDFGALVSEFTDDSPPGIYGMANHGAQAPTEYRPRSGMVAAFGDVGFPLEVGKIGMAAYDPKSSPYGWHIIKRIE